MSNALFKQSFNSVPTIVSAANGRVNLMGDHTDYNAGLVLPCQLTHQTTVYMARRKDDMINGVSDKFGPQSRAIDAPVDGGWLDFVTGAVHMLREKGGQIGGVDLLVTSDVPAGAGVSSSAALEIALLRGMQELFDLTAIDPVEMALMAQRLEHDFIGTKCGIMDQMVSSAASSGQAMMLDCQSLHFSMNDLFVDAHFVVMHCGSSRKLSEGLYNTRLQECEAAASALGCDNLRAADMPMLKAIADPQLQRRARHVVSENLRVQAAVDFLKGEDAIGFGHLMTASHESLRDDYEVSSPELDRLTTAFLDHGAFGARLTGAGFGGCVVALCAANELDEINSKVKQICQESFVVDIISAA